MGSIQLLKAFDICKTEPPSCISCKIDIFWIVPFLQNRGDFIHGFVTMRLHALPVIRYVLLATEVTIHGIKCPVSLDSSISDSALPSYFVPFITVFSFTLCYNPWVRVRIFPSGSSWSRFIEDTFEIKFSSVLLQSKFH